MGKNQEERTKGLFKIKPVYVKNPWDGGVMTLKQFFEREEKEGDTEPDKYSLIDELPKGGEFVWLNHIRYQSVLYQFLWYDSKQGYSGQSLFYRKHRGKNKLKPISINSHIPYEYLLVVADRFSKDGVAGARWALGVDD